MSRARDFADLAGAADAGGLTGRNVVVNGSFAVSQRGTSFAAPNGTYTLDRMRCAQANAADTISQQTFTAGQTDVPGSPKNYLRFAFGAATANRVLETRIEDVYTLSGQSITLSFYAKASAAHTSTIEMTQYFGSGGSSAVAFGTQSYDITTSWQRFEFSLSCPSISGKTIGAGNYLSAAFIRSLSAGPSINVDIALLQLEVGEQATPFEHRSFGDELQRCRRYFERIAKSATQLGQSTDATPVVWSGMSRSGNSGNNQGMIVYETKRNNPTLSVSSASHFNGIYPISPFASSLSGFAISGTAGLNRAYANATNNAASAPTTDCGSMVNIGNPSGYLDIDAEL